MKKNLRKSVRYQVNNNLIGKIKLKDTKPVFLNIFKVINVSKNGLLIETNKKLKNKEEIELKVNLLGNKTKMFGEVVFKQKDNKKNYYGVKLINSTPKELLNFIDFNAELMFKER